MSGISHRVRSQENGEIDLIKKDRLYENEFISTRWDLTSAQVRSLLGGMISLRVNSFSWAVPSRQDCFLVYPRYVFIIILWKSTIRLTELSSVPAINNSKLKKKKKIKWTMKTIFVLKNKHAVEQGWKVSHLRGTFFSCKRGVKSVSLRWCGPLRKDISPHKQPLRRHRWFLSRCSTFFLFHFWWSLRCFAKRQRIDVAL